jgi:endonuclease VIII
VPEGDTIFRAAEVLTKAIGGQVIQAARSPLAAFSGAKLEGRTMVRIEAMGKNLLIHLDDGRAIRTHLRMHGSWHIYRPGERWQRSEAGARLVIETADRVAVCFAAPVVELLRPGAAAHHAPLAGLGPDLLKDDFDAAEARRRLRAGPEREIGDALMDQTALAGIGNVYKSEVLFVLRVSPFSRVADLDDASLDRLIDKARELMKKNLGGEARRTRFALGGDRHHVYGRAGMPCYTCGTILRTRRQGLGGRTTYYCPRCQNVK